MSARQKTRRHLASALDGGILRRYPDEEPTMPAQIIPESHLDLFHKKAFASLATLMPSGQRQVALSIFDPDNPYKYLEVRGRVAERTREGADQHIDAMAKKYLGKEKYPFRQPNEVRVLYRIQAEHITSSK